MSNNIYSFSPEPDDFSGENMYFGEEGVELASMGTEAHELDLDWDELKKDAHSVLTEKEADIFFQRDAEATFEQWEAVVQKFGGWILQSQESAPKQKISATVGEKKATPMLWRTLNAEREREIQLLSKEAGKENEAGDLLLQESESAGTPKREKTGEDTTPEVALGVGGTAAHLAQKSRKEKPKNKPTSEAAGELLQKMLRRR